MPWFQILWTPEAIEKIGLHSVTQDEYEEVVLNARRGAIQPSNSSDNHVIRGYTSAGRDLMCVFDLIDSALIVPVTAYEPEPE